MPVTITAHESRRAPGTQRWCQVHIWAVTDSTSEHVSLRRHRRNPSLVTCRPMPTSHSDGPCSQLRAPLSLLLTLTGLLARHASTQNTRLRIPHLLLDARRPRTAGQAESARALPARMRSSVLVGCAIHKRAYSSVAP